jgi:hypothetical protein
MPASIRPEFFHCRLAGLIDAFSFDYFPKRHENNF